MGQESHTAFSYTGKKIAIKILYAGTDFTIAKSAVDPNNDQQDETNISENRFYFLLWGWVVLAAVLVQFVLKVLLEFRYHYSVWMAFIPAAIIITIVHSRKQDRNSYRTYVGDSMGYLWMGIGISFFVLCFLLSNVQGGWLKAFPFFILFYGLGTFVSGKILQFRPLVIGGICNWLLAAIAVYLPYDYQMLITGLAILVSYIIPGYMIKPNSQ